MSDILYQPAPQTEAECAATIAQLFAEMQRLNEQIRRDQADIDRLKADSERLKVEGMRLDAETRGRLDSLNAALDRLERSDLSSASGFDDSAPAQRLLPARQAGRDEGHAGLS